MNPNKELKISPENEINYVNNTLDLILDSIQIHISENHLMLNSLPAEVIFEYWKKPIEI